MFSAWIKLFLGLFCFNLDLPPGTVLKISPINGIATSLKQLFVFFSVTQKCDQSESKPRNLIKCKWQRPRLSCTCWKDPWTRSSDGFQRDARGRVTAGHGRPDTQGEVCASVSRHSRKGSGPHGTAASPTTRGGSLSALVVCFCPELLPLHERSVRGRLSPCTAALLWRGCNFELFYHVKL